MKIASEKDYNKLISWSKDGKEWVINRSNITFQNVRKAREQLLAFIKENGLDKGNKEQLTIEDFGVEA